MAENMNIRNILGFVIVALVFGLVAMIVHNFQGGGLEEAIEALPKNVDLAMKQVSYTETQEGVPRWTLQADSAAHNFGMGTTSIENVKMTFFNQGELGDVVLTAKKGNFSSETQVVEVSGDVIIQSPEGYSIHTESLKFISADRLIETDDPVRIVSDSAVITGRGLRMHLENRTFELLHSVKANLEDNRNLN